MGVSMATVETMVTEFGCNINNIVVAVGPSVGVCCFSLDRDQVQDFSLIHPDCVPDPESARPHVNIRLANRYNSNTPTKNTASTMQQHKNATITATCHNVMQLNVALNVLRKKTETENSWKQISCSPTVKHKLFHTWL